MKTPIIAILLLIMVFPFSSCFGKPRIFTTFAKAKQVGNVGEMVFDGRYYWFEGLLNSSSCYDTVKKEFKVFDAAKIPKLGPFLSMEVVNGQAWFGLNTKGVAIFDIKFDNFRIMDLNDGLPYYESGGEKTTKVSTLKYDPYRKRVWAGTIWSGLAFYDLEQQKWFVIEDPSLKNVDVTSIAIKEDMVALASYQGIYLLEMKNNKWQSCYNLQNKRSFDDIIFYKNLVVFVTDKTEVADISIYNLKTKQVAQILEWPTTIDNLKMYNNYLVISSEKGVTFYNIENKKQKTFTKSSGLISNWVNSVYFEGENMWVLTQDGISKAKIKDVLKELEDIN